MNEKFCISIQISLKFVFKCSIDRRQTITWTNDEPVYLKIYVAPGGDELFGSENEQLQCHRS